MINTLVYKAIGFFVLLAVAFGAGWKVKEKFNDSELLKEKVALEKQRDEIQTRLNAKSEEFEALKAVSSIEREAFATRLEEIGARKSYSVQCLDDDGVRAIQDAVRRANRYTRQSPAALPSTPAPVVKVGP